jgi:aldehyde:ferredoxin oxidoreductase
MMMKILLVELDQKKYSIIEDAKPRSEAIGGLGLTTTLLHRHTDRRTEPFDHGNHLFFGAGAFVGTNIPTASRCEATAVSPITGYFGTASSGGSVGAALRFCNVDGLWIRGKSPEPVYLVIDEKGVLFRDADELWGRDTYDTVDALKAREGKRIETACIGQAGERGVRFASIQNGYYHSFGRTGLGAVMGSKSLKAICFKGSGEVTVADRNRFIKASRAIRERVVSSETFGYTRRYGSMIVSDVYNKLGMLPSHNYRGGSLPRWAETRGRRAFEEGYKVRDIACFACPIGCMHWSRIKEGPFSGYETKGLEVTYVLEFGGKLGIEDLAQVIMCGEACNRLGMDVISTSSVVAYAIELFEKGMLTESDLGFGLAYGDFTSIQRLIQMIGTREGIARVLGEGVRRASAYFQGSSDFAYEIKGLEMPVRDPRGRFDSWILGFITNPRGGDHLRLRTPTDEVKPMERDYLYEPLTLSATEIEKIDMPQALKEQIFGAPPSRVFMPAMAKYSEEFILLLNACGLCIRAPILRAVGPSLMAEAFSAMYGEEMSTVQLLNTAEKLFAMAHLFNLERGMTVEEFRFPERFYSEPVTFAGGEKPALDKSRVEDLLQRYFSLRGWDEKAGIKREAIERLGIESWKSS